MPYTVTMKIAIDIRTAAGEKAGKGWYTFNIVQNLLLLEQHLPQHQQNHYILYTKESVAGFEQFKNATIKVINSKGLFWHHKVAKDIEKNNTDIFFAPSSFIIPTLLSKKVKTILAVHDLVAFLFPAGHNKKAMLIESLFLKRALKKATKILTISENTKQDLLTNFKISQQKIEIIFPAASEIFRPTDKSKLTEFAKQTNLPKNFFLAVGTLEPRKNYLNLIKAFSLVERQYPNYHLVIVGQKGWDFEPIFDEIRSNYLQKKVHVLGYLSNSSLANLYNLAKAFVFPSFYEGFGIPPLEAMQSGCPVIASNTSSIPEVVEDSAILIDPQSYTEISGAMIKLIKDEDFGESLRQKGLLQAKKFSWEKSAEELLEVIRS